mgnify:CR=1 FL=1
MQGITWLGVDLGPSIGGRGNIVLLHGVGLKGQGGIGEILSREHFLGNIAVHSDGITFQHGEGLVSVGGRDLTIVNAVLQLRPTLCDGIGDEVLQVSRLRDLHEEPAGFGIGLDGDGGVLGDGVAGNHLVVCGGLGEADVDIAPIQENPAQLNTKEQNKELSITQGSSPIPSSPPTPRERTGRDGMRERESYRELILENIEYDILIQNAQLDKARLDELVELMVDTVCSKRQTIRIAGDDYPAEVVKSRFLKLTASHIEYILDRMRENTTYVRNIKKYLLAALYNAPVTMDSYYTSLVNHDLYGSGDRR